MSAVIINVDFEKRRYERAGIVEPKDRIVRREVLDRCQRIGGIPSDLAHFFAEQAAQTCRRNPMRETSTLADNAVRQAIQAAKDRNTDPTRPLSA